MNITLYGAAGEVTGSAYHLEADQAHVLVDFGIFQGSRADEQRNVVPDALDEGALDAMVLTHAHLDHSGRLPLLARAGYRRPIYATRGTIDIVGLLLRDSARIQEDDARRENRRRERARRPPLQPAYTERDVERLLGLLEPLPYDRALEVAPGVTARAVEAGHVLGSASLELTVEEGGRRASVVFSGDVGPRGVPILRDPEPPARADLVFLESTYGDRDHRPLAETVAEFEQLVLQAALNHGKVLVPSFTVGRAQQLLYYLAELFGRGAVPPIPVYLDSPMAIAATEVYLRHPELTDEDPGAFESGRALRRELGTLRFVTSAEESRALNREDGPCVIIAGAGMANAGRIVHHLRHNLWREEAVVLIVGYQAEGTLGRQLAEGARQVSIFGDRIAVRASVHTLGGFSAHAGQSELLEWLAPMAAGKPRVVLTHGEERGRQPLAERIAERFDIEAELPEFEDVISL
jgi:metallo-beta-lactamase family protein